jgi:hypothetical protein
MRPTPYHLAERGVSVGVLSAAEVEDGLSKGRLSAATLSWRDGEPGWVALAVRPEFAVAIWAVPPPSLAFNDAPLLRLDWHALARTMRAIWLTPRLAFRPPADKYGLSRAAWWVLVCATLAAPFLYVQLAYMGGATSELITARMVPGAPVNNAPTGFDLGRFAAFFAGFPLAMVVLILGGACLLHTLLDLLGGGKAGLRVTACVGAYVGGAMLMLIVVPCGWALVPFVTFGYLSVALREAHRDDAWKPLAALAVAGFCAACVAAAFMALAVWPFIRPMG